MPSLREILKIQKNQRSQTLVAAPQSTACNLVPSLTDYKWSLVSVESDTIVENGTLEQILNHLKQKSPVDVILPASDGLCQKVAIPAKRRKQQLAALPFILRKKILADPEGLVFDLTPFGSEFLVAGFSKDFVTALHHILINSGIVLRSVKLDTTLLPQQPGEWHILECQTDLLITDGHGATLSVTREFFPFVLSKLKQRLPRKVILTRKAESDWLSEQVRKMFSDDVILDDLHHESAARTLAALVINKQTPNLLNALKSGRSLLNNSSNMGSKLAVWASLTSILMTLVFLFHTARLHNASAVIREQLVAVNSQLSVATSDSRLLEDQSFLVDQVITAGALAKLNVPTGLFDRLNSLASIEVLTQIELIAIDYRASALKTKWRIRETTTSEDIRRIIQEISSTAPPSVKVEAVGDRDLSISVNSDTAEYRGLQ